MLGAVVFDMDGLLIDSEPFWRAAELEVFCAVGVPLTLELARQTIGLRTADGVDYWHARYPWPKTSKREVTERIIQRGLALIRDQGMALPGAREAVRKLAALGVPLALASSSEEEVITAVLTKLDLADCFWVVQSAEHEPYGKPHPAVYLAAAHGLGVAPETCLAIEDTVTGVIAAKAARMACVAVPAPDAKDDRRFGVADAVQPSLAHLDADLLEALAA